MKNYNLLELSDFEDDEESSTDTIRHNEDDYEYTELKSTTSSDDEKTLDPMLET